MIPFICVLTADIWLSLGMLVSPPENTCESSINRALTIGNSTDETGCFAVYGMEYAPGA